MPKVIDDHRERDFRAKLQKRSTKNPATYLMTRLGIAHSTAIRYLRDPTCMRLRDLMRLGFTDEEILEVMK